MIRDPKVQEVRAREGFPLYLFTALAIGLVAGLLIAWLFYPVRPSGISPAELPRLDKENYRTQIAMAYAATGDANRAAARLNLLGDIDPIRELNIQAQLALLSQDTQREARALSQLAQAIYEIVLERFSEEAETGIRILPEAVYTLTEVQNLCEGAAAVPLLRVFMLDAEGNPQSETLLKLSSVAGEEESLTGLIPEQGAGYADFNLFPDEDYQLSIGTVLSVSGILSPSCQDEDKNGAYWGSQLITLRANP
jgi:hypothetical protein